MPVASRIARSVAAFTLSWKLSNRSQVIAVSNVSLMRPAGVKNSRAYGMRINAFRQIPAAPSRCASPALAASGVPPWSAQHSSARAFRAYEHAVGARSSTRSRQSTRFQYAARRHDAQAFDEIVYMRVETGEMTARTCRDPAAKG